MTAADPVVQGKDPYALSAAVKELLDAFDTRMDAAETAGGAADASIVVGSENTNVRAITIQLKKASGADVAARHAVRAVVFADANGDAFAATGGSTGIAIGTDGALLALVAKKSFILISEADGDIDLTWTDTGTEAAYLGLILPNGKLIISDALTNT